MGTGKYIKQLAGESAVYGISGTISKCIGVFLIPIYTRVFSPDEYGVIALIGVIFTLFRILTVLGLDQACARWFYGTREVEDRKSTISSNFWCRLTVSSVTGLILFVFAPQISLLVFRSEQHVILIRLAAGALPLGTCVGIANNLLRYQRRAWARAIFSTANTLATVGLVILFVVPYRWGLMGVFSAKLLAAGIGVPVAIFILRSWVATSRFSLPRLKTMLVFGLPFVPAALASWIRISSDRLILDMFWPRTEVGLYAIAAALSSGVVLFTGAFQLAWGPFAYSILDEEKAGEVYARVLSIYFFFATLLCTGISLFSVPLFSILTTKEYFPASSCVPFLTYSFVFTGALSIASIGSAIAKKSMPVAISIFIAAAANLILNFTLIPHFGKEGAAFATMISSLLAVVYLFPFSQKNYHIPYKFKPALAYLGFSWLLIGIGRFLIPDNGVSALVIRAAMCLLFVPLALLTGTVRLYDLKRLVLRSKLLSL